MRPSSSSSLRKAYPVPPLRFSVYGSLSSQASQPSSWKKNATLAIPDVRLPEARPATDTANWCDRVVPAAPCFRLASCADGAMIVFDDAGPLVGTHLGGGFCAGAWWS